MFKKVLPTFIAVLMLMSILSIFSVSAADGGLNTEWFKSKDEFNDNASFDSLLSEGPTYITTLFTQDLDKLEKTLILPSLTLTSEELLANASSVSAPEERFGIRFTGYITAPASGKYVLNSLSDNTFVLYIDGKTVLEFWEGGLWSGDFTSNYPEDPTGEFTFEAGKAYKLEGFFTENYGGQSLTVNWTKPDGTSESIPASAFTHDSAILPISTAVATTAPGASASSSNSSASPSSSIPTSATIIKTSAPDVHATQTVKGEPSDNTSKIVVPIIIGVVVAAAAVAFIVLIKKKK